MKLLDLVQKFYGPNVDNFKDVYKLLNNLNTSKKIKSINELTSSISFKKNMNIGKKIKIIGEKILKETIRELDSIINNEVKKPKFWDYKNQIYLQYFCIL